jgi:serine/threonine protein kinase
MYEELGKGAYGTVRMAYDKENKQKVAVKVYEKWRLD